MRNLIQKKCIALAAIGILSLAYANTANAQGTVNGESVSLCTVSLEQGFEAVVVLDHLTGKISAVVLNPNNGKVLGTYEYTTVNKDLSVKKTKKPKFVMIGGKTAFRNAGGGKMATGAVYIMEETSGWMAVYGMLWNPGAKNSTSKDPFRSKFIPLSKFQVKKPPRGR